MQIDQTQKEGGADRDQYEIRSDWTYQWPLPGPISMVYGKHLNDGPYQHGTEQGDRASVTVCQQMGNGPERDAQQLRMSNILLDAGMHFSGYEQDRSQPHDQHAEDVDVGR